ncbi:MAG: TonB-dependent receptor [Bacteroidota bacterium]
MFSSVSMHAQETELSLSFQEVTLKDIIEQIESKSSYQFFFVEDWLGEERLSGTYERISLEEILNDLFKESLLNYYITPNGQVILTRNNNIYDSLPEGFFGTKESEESTQTPVEERIQSPVFFNQTTTSEAVPIETIRIGKADGRNNRAQFTLAGTIQNATNQGPAPNVAISVKGRGIGTVTKEDGSFSLQLPAGLNVLETNSLGFQKVQKRVILYNNGELNFSLREAYEGLDEVFIQANVDRNVKETGTGVTKINVEKIKNIPLVLGERDIFKAAATLPGISSAGEGAQGYNVRGGKVDQNLILLDDGVIYNPTHFFGIFSAINPFTSNEVTIYKGHVPAKYGGRLSSVFDIKTKDANTEKLSGEASIGPVTSNLVLEVPLVKERSALMVGGRSTYSNWILRSLDEEELQKSEASFYDVILKYNDQINENNKIEATAYYSRDAFSITSDSLFGYSNRLATLKWQHKFNDKHNGNLMITNSQYKFDIEFDGQTNTNFDLDYAINETELKAGLRYQPNKLHTIDYGLSSKLYNVDPGSIAPRGDQSIVTAVRIPEERGLESALYVSDLFSPDEKWTFEAGVRLSFFAALGASVQNIYGEGLPITEGNLIDQREFGSNEVIETYAAPEVRASARYLIRPDLSVKGSYNSNYQYIHRLSSNTTASPIDTWKLSDLNIKPQRSRQYALGFFKNLKDNTIELSLEGYYKQIDDLIDYKVGGQLLLNEAVEQEVLQGEGRAYGIELLVKKVNGKLNGWAGYTYSRSEIRLNGRSTEEQVNNGDFFPSNFDKPHDFSLVGNYKITQRYSVSANFVYQTGRPVTVPVGNFILNDTELVLFSERNAFRVPDFYRLDVSFNIEGNHKIKKLAHSFWNISIYNVLGRNNPYSVFFVTEEGQVKAFQSSIFSIPIPTISYNLKF